MRPKPYKSGAEPPINHPRYEKVFKIEVTADTPLPELCKLMANSDPEVRKESFSRLPDRMHELSPLSAETCAIVWKGLFYFYWHADGQEYQDACAAEMCGGLMASLTKYPDRVAYCRAAFECMVREWHGLDKHRVDKYLYLVRVLVCETMRQLKHDDATELLRLVLSTERVRSLGLHVVDVFLDEMSRIPLRAKQTLALLRDVIGWALATLVDPVLHTRITEWIIDPICAGKINTTPKMAEVPAKFLEDLAHALTAPETNDRNRATLAGVVGRLTVYLEAAGVEDDDDDDDDGLAEELAAKPKSVTPASVDPNPKRRKVVKKKKFVKK
eukprot:PhM_4_TR18079/c1_g2_i1/m.44840/K14849/RRP1; ribosomal RNA-processing protein 1